MKKLYLLFILIFTLCLTGCVMPSDNLTEPVDPDPIVDPDVDPVIVKDTHTIILSTEFGTLEKNEYVVVEDEEFLLPSLSFEGYTFLGWKVKNTENIISSYTPTEDDDKKITIIAYWKQNEPTVDPDVEKANYLKNRIENLDLDNVLSTWITSLNNLYDEYNLLNSEAKALVTNITKLESAILKATCLIKAQPVIDAIEALPSSVRLVDKDAILAVQEQYNALSNDEKSFVTNYQKLTNATQRITELESECGEYPELINDIVLALPYYVTYEYKDQVMEAWDMYQDLNDTQKEEVAYYDMLAQAYNDILAIEQDTNTITYCLGNDVYASKAELCVAWYSDFYKFILTNGGKNLLESEGIYTVERFVELAQDWNAGNGTMRYLGNTFSQYYLKKDVQGILENQTNDYYIGFCLENGRYVDYIPFSIMEFAYWRKDEGYATINNYGTDAFADRWATLVDNCKFFYCEAGVSPTPRTERMSDCFNFIANVVYGDLPTALNGTVSLNTNLTRRGWTFAGWYDNPEFSGSPITSVTSGSGKKILYAKWVVDQNQVDKDTAALCDIYIYNLTTTQAVLNATTVGYVKTMYNKLTSHAKTLVTRTETLNTYINEYCATQLAEEKVIEVYLNLENKTFDALKADFLNDFNTFNSLSITDFNDFIKNRYSLMTKIRSFYQDSEMFTKWSWLPTYFTEIECFAGVVTQAKRVLAQSTTGDCEYLSKAIGYYFMASDATGDSEVAYDFTDPDTSTQNKIVLRFTTEKPLPTLDVPGYEFAGYFADTQYQNRIDSVNDETPTVLYAKFVK